MQITLSDQAKRNIRFDKTLGVFIGRFQPFHAGHLSVVEAALKEVDTLLILVGSVNKPRDYYNPWTYEERVEMIKRALTEDMAGRVEFIPIPDSTYSDDVWLMNVQMAVDGYKENSGGGQVYLVGHKKDGTGFYLDLFPQWLSIAVPNHANLSSTQIRERYFLTTVDLDSSQVPLGIISWLEDFKDHDHPEFWTLKSEYEFVAMYQEQYRNLEHPPIFTTVDAVVVQSGHVLLVKRKNMPGRGLWALPGGFLDAKERIVDGVYRELIEETDIAIGTDTLIQHTKARRVFDGIYRSSRGRTITNVFLIRLPNGPLPLVKPQEEEVSEVRWIPVSEIRMDEMFEDHGAIIAAMLTEA